MVTANLAVGEWPKICGGGKMTAALRARLTRHGDIVATGNESRRCNLAPVDLPRYIERAAGDTAARCQIGAAKKETVEVPNLL